MERLGIEGLASRSFGALSGGQQQRVLLARALSADGRILLLDEPTSGLDPKGTEELYETVSRLNREGVTVIMITHDLGAVDRYATSVLRMSEEPVFYADAEEYRREVKENA
jgi:zinc transport system ATP-binding protein